MELNSGQFSSCPLHPGTSCDIPHFQEINARGSRYPQGGYSNAQYFMAKIKDAASAHKAGAAVDVHSLEDYKGMRLFLTPGGHAGFAIKPDGELTSVFKHPVLGAHLKNVGQHAAAHAGLLGGATHLSAFDTVLPKIYQSGGFKSTARIPWNEDYKPENWPTETLGRPDVIAMGFGASTKTTPEVQTTDDYDEAMASARQVGLTNKARTSKLRARRKRKK